MDRLNFRTKIYDGILISQEVILVKSRFVVPLLCIIFLFTGCFAIYRDRSVIDGSLQGIADYIDDNVSSPIIISAHDARHEERGNISISIVLDSEDKDEQFEIMNTVVTAIDEYLLSHDDIDGCAQEIIVCFVLPTDRFSGVPGDALCEVTNQSVIQRFDVDSDNDCYENELVAIRPLSYGYVIDYVNCTSSFEIPDQEFTGIHIMCAYGAPIAEVEEYISSWPSIDKIYCDSSEVIATLQGDNTSIEFVLATFYGQEDNDAPDTYGHDFPGDSFYVEQFLEDYSGWFDVLDAVNEYRNSQEYSTDDLDIRRERIVEILSNLDGDYVLESSIDSTSIPECVSGVTQDGISFRIGIMDPEWYETHNG